MTLFQRILSWFQLPPSPDLPGADQEPPRGESASSATCAKDESSDLFENVELLPDPVFRKDGYLGEFAILMFRQLLGEMKREDLAAQVRASNSDGRMAAVLTGRLGFWAFDLDAPAVNGVSVRDEFLSRTKEKFRKPPPSMASFTAEQRIVIKGVVRIQVEVGRGLPGQYEICQLKTIGWYLAEILMPQ